MSARPGEINKEHRTGPLKNWFQQGTVTVAPGEITRLPGEWKPMARVTFRLEKSTASGEISFTCDIENDSAFSIDDRNRTDPETPVHYQVPAGTWNLSIGGNKYKPIHRSITVGAGEHLDLGVIHLERE